MVDRDPNLRKAPEEALERLVDEIQDDLLKVDSDYSEEELRAEQERFAGIGMNLTLEETRHAMFISELVDNDLLEQQEAREELKRREKEG